MKKWIYAYSTDTYLKQNWYKIGETTQEYPQDRIKQQDSTSNPEELELQFIFDLSKYSMDSKTLESKIHKVLINAGRHVRDRREWFVLDNGIDELKQLIESILDDSDANKLDINLKKHQIETIEFIKHCYTKYKDCLLYHKPRSGKTYIALSHIKDNQYKNVIVLTSYPILNYQWIEHIEKFKGFKNYNIINVSEQDIIELDKTKNNILLISFQDIKGGNDGVFSKEKFDNIRNINFELLVIDEVHFGTETYKSKEVLTLLNYKKLLGLSATPVKNLISGTFGVHNTHSYTIIDEIENKKLDPISYNYADINYYIWNLSNDEKKFLKVFSDEEQFTMTKLFRLDEFGEFVYKSDIEYIFKKLVYNKNVCKTDKRGFHPLNNSGIFNQVKSVLLFVTEVKIQEKLKELLLNIEEFNDEFNIHITNSNINNSNDLIRKIRKDFKSKDRRNIIIAVDQLTTGITLDDCDMVMFMNDWQSIDKYTQASYRCQSPRDNKHNCFVIDFNAARCLKMIYENSYVASIFNKENSQEIKRKWFDCVNVFYRTEGEFKKYDYDSFNKEYYDSIISRTNFTDSCILQQNFNENIINTLINLNIERDKLKNEIKKLNKDGIDKGKNNEKLDKIENTIIENNEKLNEYNRLKLLINKAKAILDKTMLLSLFTRCKYDDIDEIFYNISNNKELIEMYLESLFLKDIDIIKIKLNDIIFIYNNIYDKDVINRMLTVFNYNFKKMLEFKMLRNALELINSYLKPSNSEKKGKGEVFTPFELINEMLDKLPIEVWTNPNLKWLDPANGIGNFFVVVLERLMSGLKDWEKDEELRMSHILENMLYACDIQPKNMFIYLQLFDNENKYKKMNWYRGSFLDDDFDNHMENIWKLDKIDIIVGNPPYQNSNATGDNKLYLDFIKKSLKILRDDKYLCFITPKNSIDYLLLTDKNRNYVDNFYKIIYLCIDTPKRYFIGVGSTFCFFILQKTLYFGDTLVEYYNQNNIEYNNIILEKGEKIPSKLSKIDFSILKKINSFNEFFDFKIMTYNENNREKELRIRKKQILTNKVKIDNDIEYKNPIIDNINKGNPYPGKVYYFNKLMNNQYSKKIILSRSGNLCPSFDDGKYGCSDNFMYLLTDNEKNVDSLISIIESKIYKYISSQFTMNGFSQEKILRKFPKIDLSKIWTDIELYKYFYLIEEEIDLIENTIKLKN